MLKMTQKIHFFALEVAQTTSRCFFQRKLIFEKKSIFQLRENFENFFSSIYFSSAWKKFFFSKNEKYNLSAFQRRFKCPKIMKIRLSKLIWKLGIFCFFYFSYLIISKNKQKQQFSSASTAKTKSLMKKISSAKNVQNDPKNSFFCIRSCKNNF